MTSKQSSSKQNASNSSVRGEGPSNYNLTISWGGYQNFMHSYGLKPGQEEEASLILDAFREADRDCSSQGDGGSVYGSGSENDASVPGSDAESDDEGSEIAGSSYTSSSGSHQSFVAPDQSDVSDSGVVSSDEHSDPVFYHFDDDTFSEQGSASGELIDEVYYSDGGVGSETSDYRDHSDSHDSESDVDGSDSDGGSDVGYDDSEDDGSDDD